MSEIIYKCHDCGHIGEGEEHYDSHEGEYGSVRCSEKFLDYISCKKCGVDLLDIDEIDNDEEEYSLEYNRLTEAGDLQGLRELVCYEESSENMRARCANCEKYGKCVIAGDFKRNGWCYEYIRK